jgi:hypothetical protein
VANTQSQGSGVGMTCTLGGLIQYHVQFMCSIIACLVYDQANIGGAIAPPAPMVPTPMVWLPIDLVYAAKLA